MIISKDIDQKTALKMEQSGQIKPTEYGFNYTRYVDIQGIEYTCKNNPLDDLTEQIEIKAGV